MSENRECEYYRGLLSKQQNELMTARSRIFDVRQNKNRLTRRLIDLQNEIQNERMAIQVGRSAPRVFGPLGGGAVSALATFRGQVKIGRLESQIATTQAELHQATLRFEELNRIIIDRTGNIPTTQAELARWGCN